MKIIGRLLLLAVGIVSITMGIIYIVNSVNAIKVINWTDIQNYSNYISLFLNIVFNSVSILFGLSAVFCCLRGKMSLKWLLFSVLMIGLAIYYIISYNVNISLQNSEFLTLAIMSVILPFCYILGCIFLAFKN